MFILVKLIGWIWISIVSFKMINIKKNCFSTIFQESQEKVYKEILGVAGKDPSKPITVDHINQMKFLKAFVKETFR